MDYVTYFSLSYHFHFLVYGFCDLLGFLPVCYKLQLNFEFGHLKTCYDEYVGEVFGANSSASWILQYTLISMMLSSLNFR